MAGSRLVAGSCWHGCNIDNPDICRQEDETAACGVLPMMAVFAMIVAILVARPWETWVVLALAYISLIPVSMVRFASIRKAQPQV